MTTDDFDRDEDDDDVVVTDICPQLVVRAPGSGWIKFCPYKGWCIVVFQGDEGVMYETLEGALIDVFGTELTTVNMNSVKLSPLRLTEYAEFVVAKSSQQYVILNGQYFKMDSGRLIAIPPNPKFVKIIIRSHQ